MIGRQVAALLRVPASARVVRVCRLPHQPNLYVRRSLSLSRRLYATPGRPKKAVGEPSRVIKRAVKRAAKTPADPTTDAAAKKVETKKKGATKKTKVAGTKKPATKTKAKAKAKAKAKKPLTDAQKAVKKANVQKLEITELKKAALDPPHIPQLSAYLQFSVEKSKESQLSAEGLSPEQRRKQFGEMGKSIAAQWKSSSSADVEHYNHLANTAKEKGQAEYKRWVESHTAEEIAVANKARRSLRYRLESGGLKKKNVRSAWAPIEDERAVKPAVSAYLQFSTNRHASGDFKNIALPERSKLIAKEWKALSEGEKKKYHNLQAEDTDRYVNEYNNVYGHAPPSYVNGNPQQAAAAAG